MTPPTLTILIEPLKGNPALSHRGGAAPSPLLDRRRARLRRSGGWHPGPVVPGHAKAHKSATALWQASAGVSAGLLWSAA